ncbi:hypothetical protein GCM10007350_24250 [Jeongeupia chitinilytica]|uniref:Uncharacterized protein n=1 Tax=Jeongeupia chitinilytica TaxID=1041641 RepID=A0ABQ3H0V0_9NEIS|nr:hypothetical protein GCM10007350_24250 [Jeongeupia chitinilytica]
MCEAADAAGLLLDEGRMKTPQHERLHELRIIIATRPGLPATNPACREADKEILAIKTDDRNLGVLEFKCITVGHSFPETHLSPTPKSKHADWTE